jgi:hypothetical protein
MVAVRRNVERVHRKVAGCAAASRDCRDERGSELAAARISTPPVCQHPEALIR